jgi:hypothetical protein
MQGKDARNDKSVLNQLWSDGKGAIVEAVAMRQEDAVSARSLPHSELRQDHSDSDLQRGFTVHMAFNTLYEHTCFLSGPPHVLCQPI